MAKWLFKTEPGDYSFDTLLKEGSCEWTGVKNAAARIHLRNCRIGDEVAIYHTGNEKRVVGLAGVTVDPHPEPGSEDKNSVAVGLKPLRRLPRPVTLQQFRSEPVFAGWDLLRNSRLSVMPVSGPMWKRLLELGGK
jgi:predicted RNA-binding protein with PUA-like domain